MPFKLRLVRTLTGEVKETKDRDFRTEKAARTCVLSEGRKWTHHFGDLNQGYYQHHVQIVDDESAVVARFVFMERRFMATLVLNGEILEDSWRVTGRQMEWVQVSENACRMFAERTGLLPEPPEPKWG
jgi:hypothetical protein